MAEISTEKTSFFSRISRKTQIVLICIGLLLIIGCCSASVGLYAHFTKTEGIYEPEVQVDLSVDAALADKNGLVQYAEGLLTEASDSNKVNAKKEVWLNVGNVNVENGSEAETDTVTFVLEAMLGNIKGFYEEHDGSFADGFADSSLPRITLDEADIQSISAEVGTLNNRGEHENTDNLYFNIKTVGGSYPEFVSEKISQTFICDETDEVIEKIKAEFKDTANITALNIKSDGFSINGCEKKSNGKIQDISFVRSYKIVITLEFIGEYASFGTKTVDFDYYVTQRYSFTWAGINITEDSISVEPGDKLMLTVGAVLDKQTAADEFSLSFSSSDETVATIDSDGIVTGQTISEKPITVTAKFEYLGNTYTDSCLVYVVNEVEKIKVLPASMSLEAGASATLTYELTPNDATISTVTWHTEDSSVAEVDENGNVTGVGAGETKVFAVSDDGSFRASCIVTVTQGGASNG